MTSHEDSKVVSALVELCKEHSVQCLIQIGAGDGYEGASVQEETGCRAIAIEGNAAAVSCTPRLEYHHMVIGATDGITTFYAHANTDLSGHFSRGSNETAVQAPTQRLDTFCRVRGGIQPDALIIDTEGSTMEVLEGCGALLGKVNMVYAEVQGDEIRPGIRLVGEVDKLLVSFGLHEYDKSPTYGKGSAQFNQTWVR